MKTSENYTATLVYEALLLLLRYVAGDDKAKQSLRHDAVELHNEMVAEAKRQRTDIGEN